MFFFLLKILTASINKLINNIKPDILNSIINDPEYDIDTLGHIENFFKKGKIIDRSMIPDKHLIQNDFYASSTEYYTFKYLFDKKDELIRNLISLNNKNGVFKIMEDRFIRKFNNLAGTYTDKEIAFFDSKNYEINDLKSKGKINENDYSLNEKIFREIVHEYEKSVSYVFDENSDEFLKYLINQLRNCYPTYKNLICHVIFDNYVLKMLNYNESKLKNDIQNMISKFNHFMRQYDANYRFYIDIEKLTVKSHILLYNFLKCLYTGIYNEHFINSPSLNALLGLVNKNDDVIKFYVNYLEKISERNYIFCFIKENEKIIWKRLSKIRCDGENYYVSSQFKLLFNKKENQELLFNHLQNSNIVSPKKIFLIYLYINYIASKHLSQTPNNNLSIAQLISNEKIKYLQHISHNKDSLSNDYIDLKHIALFVNYYLMKQFFTKNYIINEKINYNYCKVIYDIFIKVREELHIDHEEYKTGNKKEIFIKQLDKLNRLTYEELNKMRNENEDLYFLYGKLIDLIDFIINKMIKSYKNK